MVQVNKKIGNKLKRQEVVGKKFREEKREKAKEKRRKKALVAQGLADDEPKKKPITIEDMARHNETNLLPPDSDLDQNSATAENDAWEAWDEVAMEDANDEFAQYFAGGTKHGHQEDYVRAKAGRRTAAAAAAKAAPKDEEAAEHMQTSDDAEKEKQASKEASTSNFGVPVESVKGEEADEDDAEEVTAVDQSQANNLDPKILVTTSERMPGKRTYDFLKEFIEVIPNTTFFRRKKLSLKQMTALAKLKGFSAMIVVQERIKIGPSGLYIMSLPDGPIAYWRLTSLKLGQEMPHGAPCNAHHRPELVLNNFKSRLGHRVARQLTSLFPHDSHFRGRRVVAFHTQRDYVFFRHFRYVFRNLPFRDEVDEQKRKSSNRAEDRFDEGQDAKCRLVEIGPRFTLKLRYVQLGSTFDSKGGEYEYMWRPDSNVDRKAFVL